MPEQLLSSEQEVITTKVTLQKFNLPKKIAEVSTDQAHHEWLRERHKEETAQGATD